MKYEDLSGRSFGRLVAVSYVKNGMWLCRCSCGNEKVIAASSFKSGNTKSCGCLNRELARKKMLKHGMFGTRFYNIWNGMKLRCLSTYGLGAKNYSERGITMCNEWLKFENFLSDMYQSYLLHIDKHGEANTMLERIDNDKSYSLSNCTWATRMEQNNNKRSNVIIEFEGQSFTQAQWERKLNLKKGTLYMRFMRGWSIEKSLTTPAGKGRKYADKRKLFFA